MEKDGRLKFVSILRGTTDKIKGAMSQVTFVLRRSAAMVWTVAGVGMGSGGVGGRKRKLSEAEGEGRDDDDDGGQGEDTLKRRRCSAEDTAGAGQDMKRRSGTKLFQIPLIMTKVVKTVPARDLLILRPTCRMWNRIMSPELRKKHKPIKTGNGFSLRLDPVRSIEALAATLSTSSSGAGFPFGSLLIYVIHGRTQRLDWRSLFNGPPIHQLASFWGSHLRSLEIAILSTRFSAGLNSSSAVDVHGLRKLVFWETPGLEDLNLSWTDSRTQSHEDTAAAATVVDEDDRVQELPRLRSLTLSVGRSEPMNKFVKDLLRMGTGLESLTSKSVSNVLGIALKFMEDNPGAGVCSSLRKISLGSLGDGSMTKLINLSTNGLRLTSFMVDMYLGSIDSNVGEKITELLTIQSLNMASLELKISHYESEFNLNPLPDQGLLLPLMTSLETLHLEARGFPKIIWGSCPSLRKLSLDLEPVSETRLEECLSALAPSPITELSIKAEIDKLEILEKLAAALPGLKRLTISLHQDILKALWAKWPLLEWLELTVFDHSRELDSDLTGIPPENCTMLREQIRAGIINYEEAHRTAKTAPAIQDQKHLRAFVLKSEPAIINLASAALNRYQKVLVTDVAGYFAFALPANSKFGGDDDHNQALQLISIMVGAAITETCKDAIRARLGPGAVITLCE